MTGNDDPHAGAAADTATRLAEEIRLLVDLVVERAAPWLEGVLAAGHGEREHTEPRGGCGWCPLCAVVALARGERPEVAARVLEHAAQLIALLRAVLADRWEPDEGVHMPGYTPAPRPEPEPSGNGRVQHVAVRPRQDWDQRER
ncbi:hypothetical protein [Prauserella muralis]|uniref:Uncharacterized protein n=1 Tax=Prauserella muralis TaxID=588067 RepID=A0A2V4B1W6_9PSEU|nr:hypothetical protein [Prauserella muralis]PXY28043.1 hypothetical protein BAY60_17020 [Prauserella muralis]TWE22162.1 hypothetical protein FHX69_3396 [Prauserella muralis]